MESSMNVLDFFLWFHVYFLRGFGQDCPFIKLACWVVWQWVLLFLIRQLWWGSSLSVWAWAALMEWGLWSKYVLRSGPVRGW
jgi:hypothetical protein